MLSTSFFFWHLVFTFPPSQSYLCSICIWTDYFLFLPSLEHHTRYHPHVLVARPCPSSLKSLTLQTLPLGPRALALRRCREEAIEALGVTSDFPSVFLWGCWRSRNHSVCSSEMSSISGTVRWNAVAPSYFWLFALLNRCIFSSMLPPTLSWEKVGSFA